MTVEAALAVPLVLLLVLSVLLAFPALYGDAAATARASVEKTCSDAPPRPDGPIRTVLALTDSASLLSAAVPGLGDVLAALGGRREDGMR